MLKISWRPKIYFHLLEIQEQKLKQIIQEKAQQKTTKLNKAKNSIVKI